MSHTMIVLDCYLQKKSGKELWNTSVDWNEHLEASSTAITN